MEGTVVAKPSPENDVHFHVNMGQVSRGAQDGKAATGEMDREHGMDYSDNGGQKCECGKIEQAKYGDYIIGGEEAKPHQFPWVVGITGGCNGDCGGALISPRLVLSAFHCATANNNDTEACDHSDEKRVAVLGQHLFDRERIDSYYTIPIIEVRYPPYAGLLHDINDLKRHDVVIMVLKTAATFSQKVRPICLPREGREYGGRSAIAVGWGKTGRWHNSDVLKRVDLIVSRKRYKHEKILGTVLHKDFDGSTLMYQDPCAADSGGPLMYFNKARRSYEIIGTLVGGGYSCGGPSFRDRPGVHYFEGSQNGIWNKISSWIGWIKVEMNRYQEEQCKIREIGPPIPHKSQIPQTTAIPTAAPTSLSTILTTTTAAAIITDHTVEETVNDESEETEMERKLRMQNILRRLG